MVRSCILTYRIFNAIRVSPNKLYYFTSNYIPMRFYQEMLLMCVNVGWFYIIFMAFVAAVVLSMRLHELPSLVFSTRSVLLRNKHTVGLCSMAPSDFSPLEKRWNKTAAKHPDEIKRIYSLYKGYDHDPFPRTSGLKCRGKRLPVIMAFSV